MISIDSWFDYVMPFCQGVPDTLYKQGVIKACVEFCEETHFVQRDLPAITLVEDQAEYALSPESDEERILIIKKVRISTGGSLPSGNRYDFNRCYQDWEDETAPIPTAFLCERQNVLRVYPIPDSTLPAGVELSVRVAVAPVNDAAEVDVGLYNNYKDTIAAGARFFIKQVPTTPAYDPEQAVFQYRLFRDGIQSAKKQMMLGFSQRNLRVVPVRFGV